MRPNPLLRRAGIAVLCVGALGAHADPVIDWNEKTAGFIAESRMGTPPAVRVMAIVQTAVLDALESLPAHVAGGDDARAAAVAVVHRVSLGKLLPAQQAAVDGAFRAVVAAIPDGTSKSAGLAAGESAALAVLASRADDGAAGPDTFRPHAAPGSWVPTAAPAVPHWGQRRPWLLDGPAQFRPAAPPALGSERWAADVNEVKAFGGRGASRRSPEQTEAARFWEYSLPEIYHGVLRSVAAQPGRDTLRNARLFAAAAQAMDDALIAVFDAKYHYRFWRPVTAIRNGDADGNPATARDAGWTPMIDTPMHPEYPSAHSVLASAVAGVVAGDLRGAPPPQLRTRSPSAGGATRQWARLDDFVREVSDARVHEGVHFRFSTEAGEAMGREVGALAVQRVLQPQP